MPVTMVGSEAQQYRILKKMLILLASIAN